MTGRRKGGTGEASGATVLPRAALGVVPAAGAAPVRPVAPWALDALAGGARVRPEPPCPMRTPYQRDRDRIVHATAFRRLNHKTQVFLHHEGDHYRSRLTHSLEVAQIARTLARLLRLDEDMAEALALAHDLGHPPFGHAGERALAAALEEAGGFDHNAQSLAVVTRLERKYGAFDGLNLTIDTLEGLAKHNGPIAPAREPLLIAALATAGLDGRFALATEAPAEAQAAALADDIAYLNHDIDDGLRAGLIGLTDLAGLPLVGPIVREATARADLERRRQVYEVNRRLITLMIEDASATARSRIEELAPTCVDDVRGAGRAIVAFSPGIAEAVAALRAFLFKAVYRHEKVMRVMRSAEGVIADLFRRYRDDRSSLPPERAEALSGLDEVARLRGIGDFIAGMTDRFAIAEHRRLFDATPDLG